MSLFEFTSKTKSSVLQIDGENQIPINGFYLPVVIMPDNIKVDFRRLDNIDGLTKIKEINLNEDTVIINGVTFSGATAKDLYDSLESLFFLDESGGGGDYLDRIENLENNEKLITYYQTVQGTSTGNSVTIPTGGSIVFQKFGESGDAILSKVDSNGVPTWETPTNSEGEFVTTSISSSGAYVFSSVPQETQVAVIFCFKIKEVDYSNINLIYVISEDENNDYPYTLTPDLVLFDRDIQIPQTSLRIGDAIKVSDLAQSIGYNTLFDNKEYLILGYEITENESKRPVVKNFDAPSSFDLQPLFDVQNSYTSTLVVPIVSAQQVIGKTYNLKAYCDNLLLIEVFRDAEGTGVDTLIVNEEIPSSQTDINGFNFDLTPIVDFAVGKSYRIEITPLNGGTLQIQGTLDATSFFPYIRREVGWVYVNEEIAYLDDIQTGEETFYNTDKTLSGITRVVDFEDDSSLYFDYFDTNQSTYNIKRNFAINQFGVNISAGDGDGTGQSVGSNNINVSGTTINVNSTLSTFKGVEYSGDYSANYVDRSLVDKEFVINEIASSTSDNLYTADGEVSAVNRVSNWTNQGGLLFNSFNTGVNNFNNKSSLLIENNNTTLKADVGDGAGNITSETFLKVESDVITIGSDLQNFNALQYDADYSTNFTDRTLVDKGYVDSKGASFYDQDGTIEGNRSVYLDNFGELEIFSFNGPIASNNGAGIFKLNYDSFELGFVDTSSGVVENNIKYVPSVGFQLQDDSLQVGLRYFSDYSANYGDRSLVDKEYVVNQIANISTDYIPLPSEGTQNNERSIAILNNDGDDLEYTSDIKIDELSKQTFFKHGDQTSSAHEIVFRDSADQDQFVINKDKEPGYLQSLSGNDLKLNDYTIPETGDSFTLPSSDGVNGSSLVTDGSGVLGFKELVKFPNETTGSESISIGTGSNDFATGENNIAIGESALSSLNTVFGSTNNAIGSFSQENNETGGENNSLGFNSLRGLISGSENTAVGHSALEGDLVNGFNGSNNTTLGAQSFGTIANTGNNLTTADNCVALGFDTKASADGVSNEVVIGASATGKGSNTVTLGADTNTQTFLTGEVDIDGEYTLPTTEGTEGQVLTADGVGGTSFEDASNGYTVFPIWAEDNSPLENTGLEWSFGNGGKSNNQIPIPIDCELFAFTFHAAASSGSASINILKRTNGVSNIIATSDTFTGTEANTQIFTTPYPWSIGEPVHFRTDTVTGTVTNVRVCAWFRAKATRQGTSLLGELLDVSLPSPTVGDVLSYNGTNWEAVQGATSTIKTASFMSTISQDVGTATNGIGTNIQINMTNVLGPNSLGYGLSSGNITIPSAGWYKISLKSLTTTTTTGRQNTSFVVKRNSADIAGTKVAGYNRNTANNTASATLCPTLPQFQFAQGDTIGLYAISGGDNSQTSVTVSQECILTLELI